MEENSQVTECTKHYVSRNVTRAYRRPYGEAANGRRLPAARRRAEAAKMRLQVGVYRS